MHTRGGRRLSGRSARRFGVGLAMAVTALVAAACGSSGSSTTTTSGASSTSTNTAAPAGSSGSGGSSGATVKTATVGSMGKVLVDAKGFTLYTYTRDHGNTSACTGSCAGLWPPLTVAASTTPTGAAHLGTIMRADGSHQVTFEGHPLYTFTGDTATGQANGQGYGGTWYVVHPSGSSTGSSSTTTSSSAGGYGY